MEIYKTVKDEQAAEGTLKTSSLSGQAKTFNWNFLGTAIPQVGAFVDFCSPRYKTDDEIGRVRRDF